MQYEAIIPLYSTIFLAILSFMFFVYESVKEDLTRWLNCHIYRLADPHLIAQIYCCYNIITYTIHNSKRNYGYKATIVCECPMLASCYTGY